MADSLRLKTIKSVQGTLHLPGSKSISNRVLLLSALGKGNINIENLLHSNDVEHMLKGIHKMGIKVNKEK